MIAELVIQFAFAAVLECAHRLPPDDYAACCDADDALATTRWRKERWKTNPPPWRQR